MRSTPVLLVFAAAAIVAGAVTYVAGTEAARSFDPKAVYSTRTEPGASGHKITTVVVPVDTPAGTVYCIISEDKSRINYSAGSGDSLALAQTCELP